MSQPINTNKPVENTSISEEIEASAQSLLSFASNFLSSAADACTNLGEKVAEKCTEITDIVLQKESHFQIETNQLYDCLSYVFFKLDSKSLYKTILVCKTWFEATLSITTIKKTETHKQILKILPPSLEGKRELLNNQIESLESAGSLNEIEKASKLAANFSLGELQELLQSAEGNSLASSVKAIIVLAQLEKLSEIKIKTIEDATMRHNLFKDLVVMTELSIACTAFKKHLTFAEKDFFLLGDAICSTIYDINETFELAEEMYSMWDLHVSAQDFKKNFESKFHNALLESNHLGKVVANVSSLSKSAPTALLMFANVLVVKGELAAALTLIQHMEINGPDEKKHALYILNMICRSSDLTTAMVEEILSATQKHLDDLTELQGYFQMIAVEIYFHMLSFLVAEPKVDLFLIKCAIKNFSFLMQPVERLNHEVAIAVLNETLKALSQHEYSNKDEEDQANFIRFHVEELLLKTQS